MHQKAYTWRMVCGVTVVWGLAVGCENWSWRSTPPEPAPAPRPPGGDDPLLAGTIGSETVVANVNLEPLRGFGLVVGLEGRGSSDCPTVIREYLIDFLSKQVGPQGHLDRRQRPSPAELIDSLDTAVVQVTAVVPIGARKGSRLDLEVTVVAGSSTQSLEGGLLLPTQMRFFDRAASGRGLVEGVVLAEAGGPLFVNPFADATGGQSKVDLRRGYVLGGGRSLEDRPIRLMLLRPSYRLAQAIERRINERFGQRPKTAEAVSAGYVELRTPAGFDRQPLRLLAVVQQLYLDNRPAAVDQRLQELKRLALSGEASLERISAAWEGMGRGIIPHLRPFYGDSNPALQFYAARAGLRLGDLTALPVIGGLATSGSHGHRLLAIRELGECDSPQAGLQLVPLLADPDQELRLAAYEALLQHGSPVIQSVTFPHRLDEGQINFILDIVDSPGPPLIYVRRTRLPRIAVFGRRMALASPVFYTHPDDSVTIHTVDGADDVEVYAKQRGRLSEPIVKPPLVADLITALADLPRRDRNGRVRGLGLPYSRVVQILAAMSRDGSIPARVVLEQPTLTELLGPEAAPERPESEAQ